MGGPAYDPESVIGIPSGEIGIMGPEAAINAVYARKLAAIDDPEERAETEVRLREEYREDIDIHRMASEVVIDEIVPPSTPARNWLPASRSTRTWRRTCRTRNTGRSSDSPDYSAVAHSGPSSPRAPEPEGHRDTDRQQRADVRGGSDQRRGGEPRCGDGRGVRGGDGEPPARAGDRVRGRHRGEAPSVEPATRAVEPRSLPTGTTASDVGSASNRRTATKTTDWPTVAPITRRGEHRQHRDRLDDADGDDRRDEQRPPGAPSRRARPPARTRRRPRRRRSSTRASAVATDGSNTPHLGRGCVKLLHYEQCSQES